MTHSLFSDWSVYRSVSPNEESLPSQLLFRYTDTNTGGTVKKSTTEFTSNQNHSLSLAAINCKKEELEMRFSVLCTWINRNEWLLCFTYTKAKVQQEEDVERHVDLQREVFVEVLAGLNRTIKKETEMVMSNKYGLSSMDQLGYFLTRFH